jgi:hypothetical protein
MLKMTLNHLSGGYQQTKFGVDKLAGRIQILHFSLNDIEQLGRTVREIEDFLKQIECTVVQFTLEI